MVAQTAFKNPHQDVLGSEPEDAASRLRLIEEIKNRAKGIYYSMRPKLVLRVQSLTPIMFLPE